MVVKVVSDSTSDLPRDVAEALGIGVILAYVQFYGKSYRDEVDINSKERSRY
ncbi:DegV family protein [Chloroflexota bacterium]